MVEESTPFCSTQPFLDSAAKFVDELIAPEQNISKYKAAEFLHKFDFWVKQLTNKISANLLLFEVLVSFDIASWNKTLVSRLMISVAKGSGSSSKIPNLFHSTNITA
jgi:hypothetical protein